MMAGMMGMAQGGMGEMGGMMGGGGGDERGKRLLHQARRGADENQFKILPVLMSVLIDQDHVQDLLVDLENSPMAIQVMDFELPGPSSRVTKPEKGVGGNFAVRHGWHGHDAA